MKFKELIAKSDKDLLKQLTDMEDKLAALRMDVAMRKAKNYSEISSVKKDIARVKTLLSERRIIAREGAQK